MLLCLSEQCLFWEDARALMALLEAKTKAAITAFDSDTAVPPSVRFVENEGQGNEVMLLCCSHGLFALLHKGGHQVQSREVRPSASLWTTTAFLAWSKFCLRTNHCSAWVQSSPWKEHPDFSRRIHPYHKIPGPRWKLIVCGKLRTQ